MMPIALGWVIVAVVVVPVPGPWPRVGQDDVGPQPTIEIGGEDGGLDPGAAGGVVVVTQDLVVVDAPGGVVEVIVPWPVVGVINPAVHHAAT
jgi:hypothetical protein